MQLVPCFLIIGLLAIITVQVCCESSSYYHDSPNTSSFQPYRRTTLLQQQSGGNGFLSNPNSKPRISLSRAKIDIPDLDCILEKEDDNRFWKTPTDCLVEEEKVVTDRERMARQQNDYESSPSLLSLHLEEKEEAATTIPTEPTSGHKNNVPSALFHFKKTGTTIAGCCVPDNHVVLAADTRATEDTMVADKTCQKLHCLCQNAWCAGAGTSADLDKLTRQCLYNLSLHSLQMHSIGNDSNKNPTTTITKNLEEDSNRGIWIGSSVSIDHICRMIQDTLWQARGQLGANLILGGVYKNKAYLRALHPHGSMDVDLPFAALGSGGLNAMAVLEKSYANVRTVDDAIELCKEAILAGIRNDLGSGSQVDICVIYPNGTSRLERCAVAEEELIPIMNDEEDVSNKTLNKANNSEEKEGEELSTSPTNNIGVNGFGNLPFGIESKKIRMVSIQQGEQERLELWNSFLST